MNNRVLFMIIGNEVKYLQNSSQDHREWYLSMGLDANLFDSIVRGYVIDNKIIYFKGFNYSYDNDVIKAAKVFTPSIRAYLNQDNLEVYCGILFQGVGREWEPILKINENEITGFVMEEKKVEVPKENKETGPILEFKNDYSDDKFLKLTTIVTIVVLVLSIIIKIPLFKKGIILKLSSITDILLCLLQIGLLGLTIYGCKIKHPSTKYMGIASSVALVLTLDFLDILLGILFFLFILDYGYYMKIIQFIKSKVKKG